MIQKVLDTIHHTNIWKLLCIQLWHVISHGGEDGDSHRVTEWPHTGALPGPRQLPVQQAV